MTILVVRNFDNFSRILTGKGFSIINCPTIETTERENSLDESANFSALDYDGIFLTSRRATEIAEREIFSKKNYRGKVYVLGKSSFDLLKDKELRLFFDESANTAAEMLEKIPLENLRGKRFLFIRGAKSLGTVREFLKEIATLDERIVYETRARAVDETLKIEIEKKLENGEIEAACFFSPSGAESFLAQFGAAALKRTKIAVIGKTTAGFFARQGLKTGFTAPKATAEGFANELVASLSPKSQVPSLKFPD
jgi:uroporphyrinogen-III synthase